MNGGRLDALLRWRESPPSRIVQKEKQLGGKMSPDVEKYKSGKLTTKSDKQDSGSDVATFLQKARALQSMTEKRRGRLIFGLDATASRHPTWDLAAELQAEMFREVTGLDVQLVYYRGLGECRASGWVSSGDRLANLMTKITCQAGQTQIRKVLTHARCESEKAKVHGLAFIGDAVEENIDELVAAAGELGRSGVKVFMFQEGTSSEVEYAFREIAKLTGGAYCWFDATAPRQLAELLRAVAAYAAGGLQALSARGDAGSVKLLQQLK
jgi:hypothetical protein